MTRVKRPCRNPGKPSKALPAPPFAHRPPQVR